MVAAVIPSSVYALSVGCKQHKRFRLFFLGAIGLTLLVLAQALGEEQVGELGEKVLTVVGAAFVAFGHWLNYRLCHALNQNDCNCSNGKHTGI